MEHVHVEGWFWTMLVGVVHNGPVGVITGQLQLTGHSNRTLSINRTFLISLLLFLAKIHVEGWFWTMSQGESGPQWTPRGNYQIA